MPSLNRGAWLALAVICLAALAALARSFVLFGMDHADHASMTTHGTLQLIDPWTRQTPPGARVAGGYVTIVNEGDTADRLTGGSAPFAGRVEIHTMSVEDGVMRMAKLPDGLAVAPGETVELKPGGLHIMFMDLITPPREGEPVEVTLTFEKAGPVRLTLPVAPIGAGAPGHTGHSGH